LIAEQLSTIELGQLRLQSIFHGRFFVGEFEPLARHRQKGGGGLQILGSLSGLKTLRRCGSELI
jgi:hypothetical protein